jgi:hypothetical protein
MSGDTKQAATSPTATPESANHQPQTAKPPVLWLLIPLVLLALAIYSAR